MPARPLQPSPSWWLRQAPATARCQRQQRWPRWAGEAKLRLRPPCPLTQRCCAGGACLGLPAVLTTAAAAGRRAASLKTC